MIWDAIVIATLFISAILAFFRGFVREILTIIGVVGGIAGAYSFGPHAKPVFYNLLGVNPDSDQDVPKLFDLVPYDIIADGLAYGVIFVVIVIVLSIISHYISAFTQKSGLGIIDRTLGVVFGLVRGILLLGLLYVPVHIHVEAKTKKEWFETSRSILYVEWTADYLVTFFPNLKEDPEKLFDPDASIGKAIGAAKDLSKDIKEKTPSLSDENNTDANSDTQSSPKSSRESSPELSDEQGYDDKVRQQIEDKINDIIDQADPEN